MAIEVEEPETVTVRLTSADGSIPCDVVLSRAEFGHLKMQADAAGVSVGQYVINITLGRSLRPLLKVAAARASS